MGAPIIKAGSSIVQTETPLLGPRIPLKKKVEEIQDAVNSDPDNDLTFITRKINVDQVVSSGSTLLDLAISGKRRRGGGIPGGILMEIFGRSQSGKTALLAEILASVQSHGGEAEVEDPEGRVDEEYTAVFGVNIKEKYSYSRPDTVEQIFENAKAWNPKDTKVINMRGTDSLAALTTELEMSPKGDKMGMKRGKEFSGGFRRTARRIANNNWLWVCTNQVRQGDFGETTPGGMAVGFYSSIRIQLRQQEKIEKTIILEKEKTEGEKKEKKSGVEVSKIIGILTEATVIKTIDDPYRTAPIYIIYGYGIDDIRGNLQYCKDMTNGTSYVCPDGRSFGSVYMAIQYIEKQHLEKNLREQTIDLWETIEKKFEANRTQKVR
jgi:recombination protein RecA